MSQLQIRKALEIALASITPAIATAYENDMFTPIDGVPFQTVFLLPATPLNPELSVGGFFQERGIFQINLHYPANRGPKDIEARAELYRSHFFQGAMFTNGTTTVQLTGTPAIGQGKADGNRWIVPFKIVYVANGYN